VMAAGTAFDVGVTVELAVAVFVATEDASTDGLAVASATVVLVTALSELRDVGEMVVLAVAVSTIGEAVASGTGLMTVLAVA
jgi:hypothetical protein